MTAVSGDLGVTVPLMNQYFSIRRISINQQIIAGKTRVFLDFFALRLATTRNASFFTCIIKKIYLTLHH
jgi:hypothetical protein